MRSVSAAVSKWIDEGELDRALRLIRMTVERIVTEPLCTSQIFGSKVLDDLCQRIGEVNFKDLGPQQRGAVSDRRSEPIFVYIVTKLQKSGGHTRVLEDFVRARPNAKHIILATELEGRSDVDYLTEGLAKLADVEFELSPKVDYQKRLTWLQRRLLDISPKRIFLFNHHQDSVAVAAVQPDMRLEASFYHHGDHHLCLGVYVSHLEHVDPHPMGYLNCRNKLGIENTYIPLTVDDKGARSTEWPFVENGAITTCTAGRSNKIEVPYFTSYIDLVPQLLKATGGRHIHIGRLTPWALFRIRRGMKRCSIEADKFVYISWVPSVWKALQDYRVDLYVSSFPYGGGLTLIEVMGAGVPVAVHRHIFCRILSGIDLAYPEVFSWRSPEELLHYCSTVTPGDLKAAGQLGRKQYEKFHRGQDLQRFLDAEGADRLVPAGLSAEFPIETDEWAWWMERQVSLKRVISKASYRAFRHVRAWF